MKNLRRRLICLVLSMVLVMSSAVFASAITVSELDPYLISGSYYNWSGSSGSHSIGSNDKIGSILAKFYNGISLDLKAVDVHINDIYTRLSPVQYLSTLNDLKSGWGTLSNWSVPTGYGDSWYNNVLAHYRNFADEFRTSNQFQSQQTGILQNVYSMLVNGVNINTSGSAIEDIASSSALNASNSSSILSLMNTPLFNTYSYVRRNSVYGSGNFQTMNSNKYYPVVSMNSPDGRLSWDSVAINSNMDFLSAIYNGILGVNNRLVTMGTTYNSSVYTTSGGIQTYPIYSVLDSIVQYGNNNSEQLHTTIEQIHTIDNDYNNITWTDGGSYLGVSTDINGSYLSYNATRNRLYAHYYLPNGQNVFRLFIPIRPFTTNTLSSVNDINISILRSNGEVFNPDITYTYSYDRDGMYLVFYLDTTFLADTDVIVELYSDTVGMQYVNSWVGYVKYIDYSKIDYYTVKTDVNDSYIVKLFKQAKEMFFDDESLQAKRNNNSQTSAVLTNYTGSGSASASVSDFGSLKDGVTTVKSGLNTNVSVSNVFSLFNSSDGFDFWTSETLSELNTVSSTRRSGSDTPLYDSRLSEILNLMEVNDR